MLPLMPDAVLGTWLQGALKAVRSSWQGRRFVVDSMETAGEPGRGGSALDVPGLLEPGQFEESILQPPYNRVGAFSVARPNLETDSVQLVLLKTDLDTVDQPVNVVRPQSLNNSHCEPRGKTPTGL